MTSAVRVGPPRVIVVTGVSRYFGAHVAARLAADPRVDRVVGVDPLDPAPEFAHLLDGVTRVRTDIAAAGSVIADSDVEAIVHLAVLTAPDRKHGGRAAMKEQNVIGTMHLLAAGQRASRLRKLVVRSSTAAYGASFRDPAVFTERTELREVPRGGFARDILDIEGYVRGFRRRRPDVTTTVLRLAPLIGFAADTTITRYLAQPFVPTALGRDARLQFVHVDDALEVLHRSVLEEHGGTYNVAGAGVLTLSQALRRAGRIGVPVPESALSGAAGIARLFDWRYGRDQIDLLVHGRVVDTSRLIDEYGFEPRSTAAAFDDFLRGRTDGRLVDPDQLAVAEQTIRAAIRRVRAAAGERS